VAALVVGLAFWFAADPEAFQQLAESIIADARSSWGHLLTLVRLG